MTPEGDYATIRDRKLLGPLVGERIVDITQHDAEEYQESGEAYVVLHFENGVALKLPIGEDGFEILNHPEDR